MNGTMIGPYKILNKLGQGGFGIVYQAQHQTDPALESVALKILKPDQASEVANWDLFQKEIDILRKTEHIYIVALKDADEFEGRPYYVMEYIVGGSLTDRLAKGALFVDEAMHIIRCIGEALTYLHEHDEVFLHRDIKPDNILLDSSETPSRPVLVDFGTAKSLSGSQDTVSRPIGTEKYMAPERINNHPATSASDVYALAVTFFEMLVGQFMPERKPYTALPYLSIIKPEIGPFFDDILTKATHDEPRYRPKSVAAFIADLDKANEQVQQTENRETDGNKLVEAAKVYLKHGQSDLDIVLRLINDALNIYPRHPQALKVRGLAHLKQKNEVAALQDFKQAYQQKRSLRSDLTIEAKAIFISYDDTVMIDEHLAWQLAIALSEQYHIYLGPMHAEANTSLTQSLKMPLEKCDYIIPLLSEKALQNKTVEDHLKQARTSKAEHRILPVRVAVRESFSDEIIGLLGTTTWAFWRGTQDTPHLVEELLQAFEGQPLPYTQPFKPYVYICYQRNQPDHDDLIRRLTRGLPQKGYDYFLDETPTSGVSLTEQIKQEISRADFVVVILSPKSIYSQPLTNELAFAHALGLNQLRWPAIIPIWSNLRDRGVLPQQIQDYVHGKHLPQIKENSVIHRFAVDLRKIVEDKQIDEIIQIVEDNGGNGERSGQEQENSNASEDPGDILRLESPIYIERDSDQRIQYVIKPERGSTLTIRGSANMGKSSLLERIHAIATEQGKRVVSLDFRSFNGPNLNDAEHFYRQFCEQITSELEEDGIESDVANHWDNHLANNHRCIRYMERHILKSLDKPLVLTLEKTDYLFNRPFCTDFFSMLRVWHGKRANNRRWKQLDLILVTSTDPRLFITNPNHSPFNVGGRIELEPFDQEQVAEFNRRYDLILSSTEVDQLYQLLDGKPYLTHQAIHLVKQKRWTAAKLFQEALSAEGPFAEHLQAIESYLDRRDDLRIGVREIIENKTCSDEFVYGDLESIGLVRRENGVIQFQCQLYNDYLEEWLR